MGGFRRDRVSDVARRNLRTLAECARSWAKFGGCTACYLSRRAPGTPEWSAAREMVRAKLGDDAVALWAQWAQKGDA